MPSFKALMAIAALMAGVWSGIRVCRRRSLPSPATLSAKVGDANGHCSVLEARSYPTWTAVVTVRRSTCLTSQSLRP